MNKEESFDLESVYDKRIAPLMTKIIAICKEHKLPMFATLLYANDPDGEDGCCTTNLMFHERPIPDALLDLAPSIHRSNPASRMRLTTRDKEGKALVVEDVVIFP